MDGSIEEAIEKKIALFYSHVLEPMAVRATETMKEDAKWQDRTGDARKLLLAKAFIANGEMGINCMHRKEYGKYLETANDHKYAVLEPTARKYLPN